MSQQYRALVIEDEAVVRQMTIRALSAEGFQCDPAHDGASALLLLNDIRYDLVVTDLRMPEVTGHSVVVKLSGFKHRPVIVVLTGVLEPRLAKDLYARGIDDLSIKPVDHALFAAKARALVDRRIAIASERKRIGDERTNHQVTLPNNLPVRAAVVAATEFVPPIQPSCSKEISTNHAQEASSKEASIKFATTCSTSPTEESVGSIERASAEFQEAVRSATILASNPLAQRIGGLENTLAQHLSRSVQVVGLVAVGLAFLAGFLFALTLK